MCVGCQTDPEDMPVKTTDVYEEMKKAAIKKRILRLS
jgi:hypothetical protein